MIEGAISLLMAALLRMDPKACGVILYRLNSVPLRIDVVKAMVREYAEPQYVGPMIDALDFVGKTGKYRNTLAHSIWGASDDYPDSLICIDPSEHFSIVLDVRKPLFTGGSPVPDDFYKCCNRYTESDFVFIPAQFGQAQEKLFSALENYHRHWKSRLSQALSLIQAHPDDQAPENPPEGGQDNP